MIGQGELTSSDRSSMDATSEMEKVHDQDHDQDHDQTDAEDSDRSADEDDGNNNDNNLATSPRRRPRALQESDRSSSAPLRTVLKEKKTTTSGGRAAGDSKEQDPLMHKLEQASEWNSSLAVAAESSSGAMARDDSTTNADGEDDNTGFDDEQDGDDTIVEDGNEEEKRERSSPSMSNAVDARQTKAGKKAMGEENGHSTRSSESRMSLKELITDRPSAASQSSVRCSATGGETRSGVYSIQEGDDETIETMETMETADDSRVPKQYLQFDVTKTGEGIIKSQSCHARTHDIDCPATPSSSNAAAVPTSGAPPGSNKSDARPSSALVAQSCHGAVDKSINKKPGSASPSASSAKHVSNGIKATPGTSGTPAAAAAAVPETPRQTPRPLRGFLLNKQMSSRYGDFLMNKQMSSRYGDLVSCDGSSVAEQQPPKAPDGGDVGGNSAKSSPPQPRRAPLLRGLDAALNTLNTPRKSFMQRINLGIESLTPRSAPPSTTTKGGAVPSSRPPPPPPPPPASARKAAESPSLETPSRKRVGRRLSLGGRVSSSSPNSQAPIAPVDISGINHPGLVTPRPLSKTRRPPTGNSPPAQSQGSPEAAKEEPRSSTRRRRHSLGYFGQSATESLDSGTTGNLPNPASERKPSSASIDDSADAAKYGYGTDVAGDNHNNSKAAADSPAGKVARQTSFRRRRHSLGYPSQSDSEPIRSAQDERHTPKKCNDFTDLSGDDPSSPDRTNRRRRRHSMAGGQSSVSPPSGGNGIQGTEKRRPDRPAVVQRHKSSDDVLGDSIPRASRRRRHSLSYVGQSPSREELVSNDNNVPTGAGQRQGAGPNKEKRNGDRAVSSSSARRSSSRNHSPADDVKRNEGSKVDPSNAKERRSKGKPMPSKQASKLPKRPSDSQRSEKTGNSNSPGLPTNKKSYRRSSSKDSAHDSDSGDNRIAQSSAHRAKRKGGKESGGKDRASSSAERSPRSSRKSTVAKDSKGGQDNDVVSWERRSGGDPSLTNAVDVRNDGRRASEQSSADKVRRSNSTGGAAKTNSKKPSEASGSSSVPAKRASSTSGRVNDSKSKNTGKGESPDPVPSPKKGPRPHRKASVVPTTDADKGAKSPKVRGTKGGSSRGAESSSSPNRMQHRHDTGMGTGTRRNAAVVGALGSSHSANNKNISLTTEQGENKKITLTYHCGEPASPPPDDDDSVKTAPTSNKAKGFSYGNDDPLKTGPTPCNKEANSSCDGDSSVATVPTSNKTVLPTYCS